MSTGLVELKRNETKKKKLKKRVGTTFRTEFQLHNHAENNTQPDSVVIRSRREGVASSVIRAGGLCRLIELASFGVVVYLGLML